MMSHEQRDAYERAKEANDAANKAAHDLGIALQNWQRDNRRRDRAMLGLIAGAIILFILLIALAARADAQTGPERVPATPELNDPAAWGENCIKGEAADFPGLGSGFTTGEAHDTVVLKAGTTNFVYRNVPAGFQVTTDGQDISHFIKCPATTPTPTPTPEEEPSPTPTPTPTSTSPPSATTTPTPGPSPTPPQPPTPTTTPTPTSSPSPTPTPTPTSTPPSTPPPSTPSVPTPTPPSTPPTITEHPPTGTTTDLAVIIGGAVLLAGLMFLNTYRRHARP